MKPLKPLLLSLSLASTLGALARADLVERVIVRVNGDIVTQSEFEARQVAAVQQARVGAGEVERYLRENNARILQEAIQNVIKHAGARRLRVEARMDGPAGGVRVVVQDDGTGMDGARVTVGAGLSNMRDRLDAVGGTLTVDSQPGRGVTVRAWVPAALVPAARTAG